MCMQNTSVDTLYIFDGFSKEEIAYFLLMSQTQYHKKWDRILTVGDISNGCAYYVNNGKLSVTQGGEVVWLLWPGSFFWEVALITDEPRNATVEVVEDAELQVFLKDDFLTLLTQSVHGSEMQAEIMRRIRDRVKK